MKSKASQAASYLASLSNVRITEKQKAARRANLTKAREILALKRAQKKLVPCNSL